MSESADDMITYIKISHWLYKKKKKEKNPTKPAKQVCEFSNVAGYNINIQSQL